MPSRPPSAPRDRFSPGRVPGGFEDDEQHLSRTEAGELRRAVAANPGLEHVASPPSPSLRPDDSSFFRAMSNTGDSGVGHDLEGSSEQEMRRKLMDFESSFLPMPSPIAEADESGEMFPPTNRTELVASSNASSNNEPNRAAGLRPDSRSAEDAVSLPASPPTPPEQYQTPAPPSLTTLSRAGSPDIGEGDSGRHMSALETMSSSPTAAAAARTISRAISMTSVSAYETADEGSLERQRNENSDGEGEETPRRPNRTISSSEMVTSHGAPAKAPEMLRQNSAAQAVGESLNRDEPRERSRQDTGRPNPLRSRQASYMSSTSSLTTSSIRSEETGSDVTLGADYALQSGGAVPEDGSANRHTQELSRSTSLGSIASGITKEEDQSTDWERRRTVVGPQTSADPLSSYSGRRPSAWEKEGRDLQEHTHGSFKGPSGSRTASSPVETPKASRQYTTAAPTDTVIAQHVREVEVPASFATEYRERHPPVSPERKSGGANTSLGRSKGLSLKEQSSTIDRLQKENFDLKLKVHYLNKALNERSDEGVKAMISDNVELKVGLATMEKQNRTLRLTVADLERKLSQTVTKSRSNSDLDVLEDDDRPSPVLATSGREAEAEVVYLRERLEQYEIEMERLVSEGNAQEGEKRRMADMLKAFGEKKRANFNISSREEMDMWKDLYEGEVARREQVDDEMQKLQRELWQLKSNGLGKTSDGHSRSIPPTSKRNLDTASHSLSSGPEPSIEQNGSISAASSTLVEQLRHENEELRREVGAQTSMLTSRNREKERLYQEIEDLKLAQMRGDGMRSVAGDSIFERSASRAYERSASRASGRTRTTALSDAERDEYEQKHGQLRDSISELKLRNQELETKLEECLDELEQQDNAKATREAEFEEELEIATGDLQKMQTERDDALQAREELEADFENLKQEAQQEINTLETELEQRQEEAQRLEQELSNSNENFKSLQAEMRSMSDGVVRLEDDHRSGSRKMLNLQQELNDANKEYEAVEKELKEANAKIERFTVQQESSQGEIAFLREEQDADKMKIGDLESAVKKLNDDLHEESQRVKEVERRLADERQQREVIASKEKQEVQKIVNELNQDISNSREEIKRLRKSLSSREVEATEWKERLVELENNLRAALGDLNGTRSSLLKSVTKLQKELEASVIELESTRGRLAENERILRHRDALLESAGLEARKLAEMLDKERQARKVDRHHREQLEKTNRQTARTATQHESRVLELETARQGDRKRLAMVETQYKEQLMERNNLLLALWNRLSTMCGTEWAHTHSQINGKLPSIEVISSMLSPFSKNLLLAVKTIEGLVGGFKIRIRNIEKDLWKDYQILEHNLDVRIKRLDRLEGIVQADWANPSSSSSENAKLKRENRSLKDEVKAHRNPNPAPVRPGRNPQRFPSGGLPSRDINPGALASLTRHYSTSAVETLDRLDSAESGSPISFSEAASDQRWIHRLRELEKRLKAEREARLLDRSGARKRLEEGKVEYDELKTKLERDRVRAD